MSGKQSSEISGDSETMPKSVDDVSPHLKWWEQMMLLSIWFLPLILCTVLAFEPPSSKISTYYCIQTYRGGSCVER